MLTRTRAMIACTAAGAVALAVAVLCVAVPASASVAVRAAGTAPQVRAAQSVRPGASVAAPAIAGTFDYFNSDSCTSLSFCLAVGAYKAASIGLAETLSGNSWNLTANPIPSPAAKRGVFANEVSCASRTRCLLVGDHFGSRGRAADLAESWNGTTWKILATSNPAGTALSGLDDVACPTTRLCLAVGFAGSTGQRFHATAYTWRNGTSWRQIRVPAPRHSRNSELGGLSCASATNCMAVGNYTSAAGQYLPYAAGWRSGTWKLLSAPAIAGQRDTVFQEDSCPSVARCVAVGVAGARVFHAFAEVWSRGKWHVSTVRRSYSAFIGVSCPAPGRCLAAGWNGQLPLIEAWNGRTWTTQNPVRTGAPNTGDVLEHVSCVTSSHCEAVGFSYHPGVANTDQTLAEAWDGHHWALQTTVNP